MAPWFHSQAPCAGAGKRKWMSEWVTKEITPYSGPPICSFLQLRGSPGALGTRLFEDKKISPFQWWMFLKSSLFFHWWFTHFPHRSALAVYQILPESDCWGEGRAPCPEHRAVHGQPHLPGVLRPAPLWPCPGCLCRMRKGGIIVFFSASWISLRWPKLFLSW